MDRNRRQALRQEFLTRMALRQNHLVDPMDRQEVNRLQAVMETVVGDLETFSRK